MSTIRIKTYNLVIRFLLETVAFITPGFYIASIVNGFLSIILGILLPIAIMAIWGIFAVENDPSRSGKTVVKTPGWIRLLLEFAIFGFGGWCLWKLDLNVISLNYFGIVILHNLMIRERNLWLVKQ